ncbi:MAG: hypothetical protein M9920_10095 [Verrucomicrobiae bacterium]|nr:hypothetical protein [Verrucomicrobiae bacterium]
MLFSAEVAKHQCNILLLESGPNTPVFNYVVSDGVDVYQSWVPLDQATGHGSEVEWYPQGHGTTLMADIDQGSFPSRLSVAVQILFFAFNSTDFALGSNNVVNLNAFQNDPLYDLSNLWQTVEFFPDKAVKGFRVFAPQRGIHKVENFEYTWSEGYTNGYYLLAEYSVAKYDAKNALPLEFSFRLYRPKADDAAGTEDVDFWGEWSYSTESVDLQEGGVSFDAVPKNSILSTNIRSVSISDNRLNGPTGSFGYSIASKDAVPFRTTEKYKLVAKEFAQETYKGRKGAFAFIFLMLSLLPVMALLVLKKKTNNKMSN